MNMKVYSASKKTQRLGETAGSVYVISSEDIRRSGIRTVPELLRLAPGVQVARTQSGAWAISIRGFTDEYDNKLLVMVDGRSLYHELYGGIFWELQDMLVDDIDRIEVIRGPGAALWGLNAVNGVINILTKAAWTTQGNLAKFAAGTGTEVNGAVRTGGDIGAKAAYRATVYYAGHGAYPASPEATTSNSQYGWNTRRLDFRLDWDPTLRDTVQFTGSGDLSQMGHSFVLSSPTDLFPAARDQSDGSHAGAMQARWQHKFSDNSNIVVRAAWTDIERQDSVQQSRSVTGDFEFQHNLTFGGNAITWGLNYRDVSHRVPPIPGFQVNPVSSSQDLYAGYAADEFALVRDKLYFIAGVHASDNQFTGFEVQPTGRLLWTPSKKWTGWAAVSRAVRTPTLIERGFDAYVGAFPLDQNTVGLLHLVGNPNFKAEPMISYEAGQRFELGKRLSLDFSGFMSFYQDLSTGVPGASTFVPPTATTPAYVNLDATYGNARYGQSRGVEAAGTWTVTSRWRLAGGYSWLHITSGAYAGQTDTTLAYSQNYSPDHQFQIRSYYDLTRTIQFDTALYYTGAIPNGRTPTANTPAYLRGDARLGWRPTHEVELSVGVQNAFDPSHLELMSTSLQRPVEVPRNVYGSITFKF